MAKKPLNIGMVGYGFMGRAHSNAYRRVGNFFDLDYQPVLKAACGRNRKAAKAFADTWGYESVETDWKEMVKRDDIDAVDICVPNDLHVEIAIAAAKAGKMVLCEKPLARDAREGERMVKAVEKAGVANMVWYNYRWMPAVRLIKQIVATGRLGKIFHYRANFLQDWTISPDVPQGGPGTWRLDVEAAGSGVTGDLLAHCVDTAMWINGPIKDLTAMTETFVKKRKHAETGKMQAVGIDDAAAVLTHFDNGSLGLFESTRYARGHKALYTLEINGEKGSFMWNLHDLNYVQWFDHRSKGGSAAGPRSSSPTASTPISASGGCPACRSATSTPSSTPSPISSTASPPASRPRPPSARRWRRPRSATRSSSRARPGAGWR